MGSNKRYAAQIDARMDLHIGERIQDAGAAPFSLSNEELELKREPLTRTPVPLRVRAWVRYPDGPVKIEGEMVAWTPKACAVRWTTPKGQQHRAWVWASAVEQLPALPPKIDFG